MLDVTPAGFWPFPRAIIGPVLLWLLPFLGFILMHSNNSVATHLILHLFVAGFPLKLVLYYIVNRHFFTRMNYTYQRNAFFGKSER